MKKLIIVDDDFLVRKYIGQVIDWAAQGFSIAGEASDGADALELVERERPDLIITDVCMPVLDGIGLIRTLSERRSRAHILVLSSHADFDYVREAMKLGCDDYLLKDKLTPANILAFIAEHFSGEESSAQEEAVDSAELVKIGREKLLADFLAGLATGRIAPERLADAAVRAGLPAAKLVAGELVILRGWAARRESFTGEDYEAFIQVLGELGDSAFSALAGAAGRFFPIDAERGAWGALVLFTSPVSLGAAQQQLATLASRLTGLVRRYIDLGAVVVTASARPTLAEFAPSYQACVAASESTFYLAEGCYTARDLPQLTTVVAEPLPLAQLADYVREHRPTATTRAELLRRARVSDELYTVLTRAESYADFAQRIADYLAGVQGREGVHPAIAQALAIVDVHYGEPLTQAEVAAACHLNPTYFSTLFNRTMGQGFREYLARRRIEAVKGALASSTERIKDIASAAGFADYPNFCRLFHQLTGCSPQEYRAQQS